MSRQHRNGSNNSETGDDRPGPSRGRDDEDGEEFEIEDFDDEEQPTDNWELWTKIHSNRDVRLKLLCRDPDDRTPPGSNSVVVRKLPLDATKEQISTLFHKAGNIKSIYFPKVAPHFTTKYCFITFHDIRQAERAQKFFDGYQWGRDRLQVVSYDSCYKYRQQLVGPKAARQPPPEEDPGSSIVFNAVRQAEAQSESRMTKYIKATIAESNTALSPNHNHRPNFIQPMINGSVPSFFHSDAEDSDGENLFLAENGGIVVGMESAEQMCSSAMLAQEAQADLYLFRECDTVDDMLLDSEVGFLHWLDGRLKFAGPLHYTDQMISRALQKTPVAVQTMFIWLLGAFRCLSDNKRFKLVGPFICLPSHSWCAEDKCIALGFGINDWYKEEWEPVTPNQITSTKLLIKYLRCLLERFGPLRTDDIKLQQLALFLSPTAFSRWPISGESMDNVASTSTANPTTASAHKRLLDGLECSSHFRVADGVVYSTQAHYEILLLKATMAASGMEETRKRQLPPH